jgi:hypothetical protein
MVFKHLQVCRTAENAVSTESLTRHRLYTYIVIDPYIFIYIYYMIYNIIDSSSTRHRLVIDSSSRHQLIYNVIDSSSTRSPCRIYIITVLYLYTRGLIYDIYIYIIYIWDISEAQGVPHPTHAWLPYLCSPVNEYRYR